MICFNQLTSLTQTKDNIINALYEFQGKYVEKYVQHSTFLHYSQEQAQKKHVPNSQAKERG